MLSTFLAQIHLRLQKFAFGKKRIVAFLERFDTAWLRLSAKVAGGALAHGKSKNVQRIFCGHTQEALSLSRDDVEYYNTVVGRKRAQPMWPSIIKEYEFANTKAGTRSTTILVMDLNLILTIWRGCNRRSKRASYTFPLRSSIHAFSFKNNLPLIIPQN
jgi:hypothetical protein